MTAIDFYDKRMKEDATIGSVQLMEEYARHIIEINFCDGSSTEFDELTTKQLKKIHDTVNMCVEWVNSPLITSTDRDGLAITSEDQ